MVISFLLLGLLDAVTVAFESGADSADAKRLLTTARYSIIEPLPLSYLRRIEQVPGVTGVAHADWFGAKYQNESNAFPVFAVDPRRYLAMYPEFDIAPAHLEAFATTRTGAVAGQRLVDRFGWRVGQKLPISSEIHARADGDLNWEFDLVGIIDAEDPAVRGNTDVVLINVAYFDEARLTGKGKTGWYIERIADPAGARAIAAEIDRRFAELAGRDEDAAGEGVRHRLRQADRRRGRARRPDPRRGLLHDPAPDRQHHGAVDPRAHPGAGDSQDPRLLRRQGHRPRARRGPAPDGARRGPRHGGGRGAPAVRQRRRRGAASLRSS